MEKQFIISYFLDTRREKSTHKFPLKIRVYQTSTRAAKLYLTEFEFTTKEFKSTWETLKPRQQYNPSRLKLQKLENSANEIADKLKPFSFEQFEKKFLRKKGDGENVFYQYDQIIKKLKENNQIATASNYKLSLQSLKNFVTSVKGSEPTKLLFFEITPNWLDKYEKYMLTLKPNPRSRTTVSMYLRALRTVFNAAISDKEIDPEIYPFGKNKYQLPAVLGVKKALTSEQLKNLYHSVPETSEQEKAKDFWFFSFACNGMNIKDIAFLRWENLQEETLIFYRAKTINTGKTHLKPITVYITDHVRYVIEKYGNPEIGPKKLIFSIITDDQDEQTRYLKIKNFTRFVNQNLKNLAEKNDITRNISSYWARHSFATSAIRNGASMEFVSESLNHSNLRTTQGYFAGFEDKDKKEFMKTLMNF